MNTALTALLAVLSAAAGVQAAETFHYRYTWGSGHQVTGSFEAAREPGEKFLSAAGGGGESFSPGSYSIHDSKGMPAATDYPDGFFEDRIPADGSADALSVVWFSDSGGTGGDKTLGFSGGKATYSDERTGFTLNETFNPSSWSLSGTPFAASASAAAMPAPVSAPTAGAPDAGNRVILLVAVLLAAGLGLAGLKRFSRRKFS